ncbi:uncharacterized protein METZ01_LOCUS194892, partial [marine metagenome]
TRSCRCYQSSIIPRQLLALTIAATYSIASSNSWESEAG